MAEEFDPTRFTVIDHPLVQHKLHILRDKATGTKQFRELVTELAIFEGYEATRDLPLEDVDVETPVDVAHCRHIAGRADRGEKRHATPLPVGWGYIRCFRRRCAFHSRPLPTPLSR